MIKKDLNKAVKSIIATTFKVNKRDITPQTISDDVEEWDSLGHIRLILKIESEFNTKFNIVDIPKLTSVAAIITELKKHEYPS